MLSFYAPGLYHRTLHLVVFSAETNLILFCSSGWCGEVRDVIFSENGNVTVVYRLTIRGSDGEVRRSSTFTFSSCSASLSLPRGKTLLVSLAHVS